MLYREIVTVFLRTVQNTMGWAYTGGIRTNARESWEGTCDFIADVEHN
jgi:hypothetical protein